jgi:adenine-specific DNA methylase
MTQSCKKLIEVAMPIKEISAESVRDKSIRHGHISTLHLWWARRPLPVCRAVVFASLVPDPLDPNCPQQFRDAVEIILGKKENPGDIYRPYDNIPYTAAIDAMEDNHRNRLLMFIGKFSDKYALMGEKTPAKEMLTDASLIKWDNKNNETIINKARKLIWVSHNVIASGAKQSAEELLSDFNVHYSAIKSAEQALYSLPDRHISTPKSQALEATLHNAIEAFLDKMPRVFDPFAGGGAIPLEAARLGCRSFGNDINPVAHIIQKGSLEFPQKYGKPITYSVEEFNKLYSFDSTSKPLVVNEPTLNYGKQETLLINDVSDAISKQNQLENYQTVTISNRLSFDVEYYAKKLLAETEKEIGYLYPANEKGNKPIAYYWARVGICSNPSCKAEVPLLKQFYLADTKSKQVFLNPLIKGNKIDFEIKLGKCELQGWNQRTNLTCPCCGNITDSNKLKEQFKTGQTSEKLLAVIEEGQSTKNYRLPNNEDLSIFKLIPNGIEIPSDRMEVGNNRNFNTPGWGIDSYGQMFSKRQLYIIQTLVNKLNEFKSTQKAEEIEYEKVIATYLAIIISKYSDYNNMFTVWTPSAEQLSHTFSKQALPMVFDYPESMPFKESGGSPINMMNWVLKYIESESLNSFNTIANNASSGDKSQFPENYLTTVVTDPPYYDAIAYADISDFFYVWLKRTLGDLYPLNFATPQTPKLEECTALKHHHNDNQEEARSHFEMKLTQIFDAIEHQTSDIVSIMFAHQSTEAWTTLCNSILDARMNITGSWPIDTERANRSLGLASAVLASSVTVSCRPSQRQGFGNYREVKRAIEITVEKEVKELYALGFRGADLLTACFGQAVSEFGKYEKVEKADGTEVTVADLLDMARESAFNALLKGFEGDEFTKFYIGWLQLYGFVESDFDDAAKFSRVGLSINVSELFTEHILIKKGNKQTLGTYEQRWQAKTNMGEKSDSILIDQVHRGMGLYRGTNRAALLQFIGQNASNADSSFWRVVTSLCEILPSGCDDHKQATGLLTNKESLIRESKSINKPESEQTKLFE